MINLNDLRAAIIDNGNIDTEHLAKQLNTSVRTIYRSLKKLESKDPDFFLQYPRTAVRISPATVRRLLPFATGKAKKYIETYLELEDVAETAKQYNVSPRTIEGAISRTRKRVALHSPDEHNYGKEVTPPGFPLSGVSQCVRQDGSEIMTWYKTTRNKDELDAELKRYVDGYFAELPKIAVPVAPKKKYDTDLIPFINIGDAHLGMLAHESETGQNFDLKIAVSELLTAVAILINEAPSTERVVIQDLGDFTHYENTTGVTEASGHILDKDGRFGKMLDAYLPLMRQIIELCLEKFKVVDVIINQGNHSRTNDWWMSRFLQHVYETPRVNVLNNSRVFIPYRMGNTFVLSHHTDKVRGRQAAPRLTKIMATDYAKHWGETQFRYIDTGHLHTNFVREEYPGVIVECFNNLAASDKYAFEGGWRSRQAITMLYRSKTYGDQGRRVLTAIELKDRIRAGMREHCHADYEPSDPVDNVFIV